MSLVFTNNTPKSIWGLLANAFANSKRDIVSDGAPTSGASGTGVNFCGPGSTCTDVTNGQVYVNTNTKASPTWSKLVDASGDLSLTTGSILIGAAGLAAELNVKTTGQLLIGNGTTATSVAMSGDATIDSTGALAIGAGKITSAMMAASVIKVATGSISSANIVGTSSGQLGHANGVVLVAAGAAGTITQLISGVFALDYLTAAYTGGGNTTVNISGGGAALTGLVSNANFIQSGSDKIIEFMPLAATFNSYGTGANGLALVTASAPTQPGTAAGIINWAVMYRVIPSLLD